MEHAADAQALAGAARLFGDLLLRELGRETLRALGEPRCAGLLEGLEVGVPALQGGPADDRMLEELAAEYHAVFLRPEKGGAPPIGSLWTEGRFEGQMAARVRELAGAAALEFSSSAARGAPVDHLGVLLHLWAAATQDGRADVADEIAGSHLAWSEAPLRQAAGQGSAAPFYSQVAAATLRLVKVITANQVKPS